MGYDSVDTSLPLIPDIHIYDELESTNQTLWDLMEQGAKAGTVAIARQQTAGKGQWGRQWTSAIGGLYLSFALEPSIPVHHSPHLILSTVWGVALALRACQLPVSIKWPNDLVVEQSPAQLYKLGGILTETRITGQSIHQAVIGIGLNGANPVPQPGINLMNVPSPEPLDSLNKLAAIAIYGIRSGWYRLQSGGIEAMLKDYNQLLVHRDRWVEIEWEGRSQWVRVLGVTSTGHLRAQLTHEKTEQFTGTSSPPSSSIEEIRIPPGMIQLGYRTS